MSEKQGKPMHVDLEVSFTVFNAAHSIGLQSMGPLKSPSEVFCVCC